MVEAAARTAARSGGSTAVPWPGAERQIESACGVEHARQSTAHSASVEAEASVYACPSASSVKWRSTSTINLADFDLVNNPRMNDIFRGSQPLKELSAAVKELSAAPRRTKD